MRSQKWISRTPNKDQGTNPGHDFVLARAKIRSGLCLEERERLTPLFPIKYVI